MFSAHWRLPLSLQIIRLYHRAASVYSCHTEKAKGQSVHFDFTHACAVCHVVNAADGRTSITLVLAREKICYSCHEKDAMDRVLYMQGECVSCHDPHTSQRAHLLRANVPTPGEKPKP